MYLLVKTSILHILLTLFVFAESCTTDADCLSTKCAPGSKVICEHRNGAGGTTDTGHCTCTDAATIGFHDERISESKRVHRFPSNRLRSSGTEPSAAGTQTWEPLSENDDMKSTLIDSAYPRMETTRTRRSRIRRSRADFDRSKIMCDAYPIPSTRVCDGLYDCFDDRDEKNCKNRTCPSVLSIHCDTGLCYDIEKRCDGENNCRDKSDEANCDNIACPDYFFQCTSGQCVFYLYVCDLIPDCRDGSDESDCNQLSPICTSDDYLCQNGTCMRRVLVCDSFLRTSFHPDGFPSCPEKITEINCTGYNCFDPDYAQCDSGHCIDRKLWCNTHFDCDDKSDERFCSNHTCPDSTTFHCNSGHCIDLSLRCDSYNHCPGGSDEHSCENNTCTLTTYLPGYIGVHDEFSPLYEFHLFQCNSGHCILGFHVCDNRLDCPDGSDEINCLNYYVCPMFHYRCDLETCYPIEEHCFPRKSWCSHSNTNMDDCKTAACLDGYFTCRGSGCVMYEFVCDGKVHCPYADDEDDALCRNLTCPEGYYRCASGQCMSRMFICEYMGKTHKSSNEPDSDYTHSYEYGNDYRYSDYPYEYGNDYRYSDYPYEYGYDYRYPDSDYPYEYGTYHENSDVKGGCHEILDNVTCINYTCIDQRAFQCESGHCIDSYDRCDRNLDCPDGSDEMNCTGARMCYPFENHCQSGHCFDAQYQCDGVKYCLDNSDETNCLNASCPDHFFRCISGQCVPYPIRCDGNQDCSDASDEYHCPDIYCPDNHYRCRDGRCISLTFICDASWWDDYGKGTACDDDFNHVSCENYTCIGDEKYYTQCRNGRCYHWDYICDIDPGCNNSTEKECYLQEEFYCLDGLVVTNRDRCDDMVDCDDESDELNCNKGVCAASEYQCKTVGLCLPWYSVCQGYFPPEELWHRDCPPSKDDEKYCPFLKCSSPFLRMPNNQCRKQLLFNISCSESKVSSSCPHPCPNDIHYLQCCDCQCVHRVSICDGVRDCPDGADERHCGVPDCREDQFYCGNITCFPSEYRCDRFDHCPGGPDEAKCILNEANTASEKATISDKIESSDESVDVQELCADETVCFTEKTLCQDRNARIHEEYIAKCDRKNSSTCFLLCDEPCTCNAVGSLHCNQWWDTMESKNDPKMLWPFDVSRPLYPISLHTKARQQIFTFETMSEISITNVNLTRVPTRLLSCAFNIHHLDLSSNSITHIAAGDFGRLYRLSVLDLSNNLISTIEDFSFKGIRVFSLNLKTNLISNFGMDLFSGIAIDGILSTDDYRFCCLRPSHLPEHNCHPKADQLSSCRDLMKNTTLGVMAWIVGLVALLGNVGILLFKIFIDGESLKGNFGVLVINLAIADALMGAYLLSIASVDVMYRGIYITKENEWRNSIGCKVLGVLCTISSEASVLLICLITVDRYLITKYPFKQVRLSRCALIMICVAIWIIAVAIASTPLIITPYFQGQFYSQSGVCIALPLTTKSYHGRGYSVAINVGLNFVLFLFVSIGQYCIYKTFKASQSGSIVSTRKNNDMAIVVRLLLIVLTDCFCWIPIGVLSILALAGVDIHPDVYAWVTVFVLPFNSAANPFIYTLISLISNCRKQTVRR